MLVVDASVVVDWVQPGSDPDGAARRALGRWVSAGESLLAPRLMREEVANALVTGIRRRRWTGAAADVSFALLREIPVEAADAPADLDRAYELSRRYDEHPVYDMLYVALAERTVSVLVTADEQLARRLSLLSCVRALADVVGGCRRFRTARARIPATTLVAASTLRWPGSSGDRPTPTCSPDPRRSAAFV